LGRLEFEIVIIIAPGAGSAGDFHLSGADFDVVSVFVGGCHGMKVIEKTASP
jgi:hypothetical protein